MSNSNDRINRRSVLKSLGIAATAVGGAGVGSAQSGRKVAKDEVQTLKARYTSATLRSTVEERTRDVITQLAEAGYISTASVDEFDLGEAPEGARLSARDEEEGTGVTAFRKDGKTTAHIMISKDTDDYGIGLYVQPQLDRSYAVVYSKADETQTVVDPTKDVSTQGEVVCWTETSCTNDECDWFCLNPGSSNPQCHAVYTEIEEQCCDEGIYGTNCYQQGTNCNCQ
ncbi:hypothetical protein [Haladaptatus cibarius]|uniref:hypothetical protein n=1 Tax=Haladaptatus cibarius TaxID=453847 RepID=UPI000679CD7B|nr:hypothetical protein [Haladaptatus cibarius]